MNSERARSIPSSVDLSNQQNWQEPMLPLFEERSRIVEPGIKRRLFLIPTHFNEEFDPHFSPTATPQDQLPEITLWVRDFIKRLMEIMASRRSPHQLARWCHRQTFTQLLSMTRSFTELPRMRRVHIRQPLESLAEVTALFEDRGRIQAIVLRFEGVDKRWLCTVIERI